MLSAPDLYHQEYDQALTNIITDCRCGVKYFKGKGTTICNHLQLDDSKLHVPSWQPKKEQGGK